MLLNRALGEFHRTPCMHLLSIWDYQYTKSYCRNMQRRKRITQISLSIISKTRFFSSSSIKPLTNLDDDDEADPLYADVPKPRKDKSERKPYPTPMKELIRRAKEEKELRRSQPCRVLEDPPDNGLLVPELVHVARRVHRCRASLLSGLSRIVHHHVHVHRCRYIWIISERCNPLWYCWCCCSWAETTELADR